MTKRRIIVVKNGEIIHDRPVSTIGCEETIYKCGITVLDVMEGDNYKHKKHYINELKKLEEKGAKKK